MIIPMMVLMMLSHLRRSHKLISNTSRKRPPTCSIDSTMSCAQASSLNENGKEEMGKTLYLGRGRYDGKKGGKGEETNTNLVDLYTFEPQIHANKQQTTTSKVS